MIDKNGKKLTQEKIDLIFSVANKLRRARKRELTDKEIENLICNVRRIAKY
ncbi:MAG: hypothetical protein NC033_02815 [Clostridiales bacterium]|nr:hypothetical protein [Clostridiales bacterium]